MLNKAKNKKRFTVLALGALLIFGAGIFALVQFSFFYTTQATHGGPHMGSVLDTLGNNIIGLPATPSGSTSAASKQYVDTQLAANGGGDGAMTLIRWGSDPSLCPAGWTQVDLSNAGYFSSQFSHKVRTCLKSGGKSFAMERWGSDPSPCPAGWSQADLSCRLYYSTQSCMKRRVCYQ